MKKEKMAAEKAAVDNIVKELAASWTASAAVAGLTDWSMHISRRSGKPYYRNASTKDVTWVDPVKTSEAKKMQAALHKAEAEKQAALQKAAAAEEHMRLMQAAERARQSANEAEKRPDTLEEALAGLKCGDCSQQLSGSMWSCANCKRAFCGSHGSGCSGWDDCASELYDELFNGGEGGMGISMGDVPDDECIACHIKFLVRFPEFDCWDEEESRAGRAILRRYEECSESEHESSSESEQGSNSEEEEESNSEEQEEEESNSE